MLLTMSPSPAFDSLVGGAGPNNMQSLAGRTINLAGWWIGISTVLVFGR